MACGRGSPEIGGARISPHLCVVVPPQWPFGSRPSTTHALGGLIALNAFDSPRVGGVGGLGPSAATFQEQAWRPVPTSSRSECVRGDRGGRNPLGVASSSGKLARLQKELRMLRSGMSANMGPSGHGSGHRVRPQLAPGAGHATCFLSFGLSWLWVNRGDLAECWK